LGSAHGLGMLYEAPQGPNRKRSQVSNSDQLQLAASRRLHAHRFCWCLQKPLDNPYTNMITLVILARQIILPRPSPTKLTPLFRYSCSLLPLFLRVRPFVFNSLQPLLPKTGGWGIPRRLTSETRHVPHRFFTPLFSSSYKSLFSQLLCFHIHLRCPIVFLLLPGIPKSGMFLCRFVRNVRELRLFRRLRSPLATHHSPLNFPLECL